jgi:plastocyanin
MLQNKKLFQKILFVLVGIFLVSTVYYILNRAKRPDENHSAFSKPEQVAQVQITNNGFSPETISIKKGSSVNFENTDNLPHWIASDPHPTHSNLPELDSRQALLEGETYIFTFQETGVFTYHDHLNPFDFNGTVIVED